MGRARIRAGGPLTILLILVAGLFAAFSIQHAATPPSGQAAPSRIISLVPAATEMLFAIGAGPRVVGVGSFDNFPPEVTRLPRVGALLDPDVEKMLSLRPDLVVLYSTQSDLKAQLTRAGIGIYDYRHAGLADITTTIRALGARTGSQAAADALADRITQGLDGIRARVKDRPRPRVLLVFGRERGALRGIYASGGYGFLHDMLTVAGGDDVFADVKQESVQASTEQILARRPDVILEIRAADSAMPYADREAEIRVWSTLSSIPAVRNGHVQFLIDDRLVVPGPRVVEGTRMLAKALHPETF